MSIAHSKSQPHHKASGYVRQSQINRGQCRPQRTERNGNETKPHLRANHYKNGSLDCFVTKISIPVHEVLLAQNSLRRFWLSEKKIKTRSTLLTCPKEMRSFFSTEHTLARIEAKRHPKNRPAT
jgi:hypothetical protein